ncbi:MAG: hypothetical protein ABI867_04815 [Kofleriaceae bacterium]
MRALRVMLVANDGFSAGHVARTIAIARGLARRSAVRGIEVRTVLATTSEAHDLLAGEPLAIVRLPAVITARQAGFTDPERRRLVRAAIDGVVEGFAPDLVVSDTFPSGPHGELAGIGRRAKRALVRRSVIDPDNAALNAGLAEHHLAIVAGDPGRVDIELGIPTVHVPPITIAEAREALDRDAARAALAVPRDARVVLVAAGGGGDEAAVARARALAAKLEAHASVVLALGPLAAGRSHHGRLQPLLAAFDAVFAPAGYNTACELAKARVPAVLFAQPRPYDDQAARAARYTAAGFAHVLDGDDVVAALAWAERAVLPELEAGGADRAADALLELAGAA